MSLSHIPVSASLESEWFVCLSVPAIWKDRLKLPSLLSVCPDISQEEFCVGCSDSRISLSLGWMVRHKLPCGVKIRQKGVL